MLTDIQTLSASTRVHKSELWLEAKNRGFLREQNLPGAVRCDAHDLGTP